MFNVLFNLDRRLLVLAVGVMLLVAAIVLVQPDFAGAALKEAMGWKDSGGAGGFEGFRRFFDTLFKWGMHVAIPIGALGLLGGGVLVSIGSPKGTTVLAGAALGLAIILGGKGIMA